MTYDISRKLGPHQRIVMPYDNNSRSFKLDYNFESFCLKSLNDAVVISNQ